MYRLAGHFLGASAKFALILIVVTQLGAPDASAEAIRIDNPAGPGHFNWAASLGQDRTLGIRLEPAFQPASDLRSDAFTTHLEESGGSEAHGARGGEFQVGGPFDAFLIGVTFGTEIPSGTLWQGLGYAYFPEFESPLAEEQETYLGVRFTIDAAIHYGWIGVTRTGADLDAFAWGYETEPGVAIPAGIPEPGSLAMLALGATGLLARRRV